MVVPEISSVLTESGCSDEGTGINLVHDHSGVAEKQESESRHEGLSSAGEVQVVWRVRHIHC